VYRSQLFQKGVDIHPHLGFWRLGYRDDHSVRVDLHVEGWMRHSDAAAERSALLLTGTGATLEGGVVQNLCDCSAEIARGCIMGERHPEAELAGVI
jgi:hypothetical protein